MSSVVYITLQSTVFPFHSRCYTTRCTTRCYTQLLGTFVKNERPIAFDASHHVRKMFVSRVWRNHISSRHFYIKYIPRILPVVTNSCCCILKRMLLTCVLLLTINIKENLGVRNLDRSCFEWTPLGGDKNRTRNRLVRPLRNFETWIEYILNGHALSRNQV